MKDNINIFNKLNESFEGSFKSKQPKKINEGKNCEKTSEKVEEKCDEPLKEATNPKFQAFYDEVKSNEKLKNEIDDLYKKVLITNGYSEEEIKQEMNRGIEDKVAEVLENASKISSEATPETAKKLNALLDESCTKNLREGVNDDVNEAWDILINMGISEETLKIITSINGYNMETMEDVLYAAFGYRSFDQFEDEEDIDESCNKEECNTDKE